MLTCSIIVKYYHGFWIGEKGCDKWILGILVKYFNKHQKYSFHQHFAWKIFIERTNLFRRDFLNSIWRRVYPSWKVSPNEMFCCSWLENFCKIRFVGRKLDRENRNHVLHAAVNIYHLLIYEQIVNIGSCPISSTYYTF